MPLIEYPDVPDEPGVPNIPRNPTAPPVQQSTQPTTNSVVEVNTLPWMIVDDNGGLLLSPDTYADFQVRAESVIPNYPIEKGGFSSYNQVEKPYGIKLTAIVTGKSGVTRNQFIESIQSLKSSLTLASIVTPYTTYSNAKLIDYNWTQKSDHGLTMLMIELTFQEIRQTANAVVTVANPSGQDKKSIGQVSPIPPTNKQASQSLAFKPYVITPQSLGL